MWSLGSVRSYRHALKLLVNILELWGDTGVYCLCISHVLNFHLCISTQTQQIRMVAECWEVWFPTQGQNSLTWGLPWRSSDWGNMLLMHPNILYRTISNSQEGEYISKDPQDSLIVPCIYVSVYFIHHKRWKPLRESPGPVSSVKL